MTMIAKEVGRWIRPAAGMLSLLALPGLLCGANQYIQHNLSSDIQGMADHVDPGLINPWGIAISATSPFWFSDNGSGLSTLYSTAGDGSVPGLVVTIPPSANGGATSRPTGIVFNSTTGFEVAPGQPGLFIFDSLDGAITAWNRNVDLTHALIKVDNSSAGAVYTGLAIGVNGSATYLYAANFHAGTIDVFDSNFNPVSLGSPSFYDNQIPEGYAPFNVQNLGGMLYVTYAKQDTAKQTSVPGPGYGYVNVFNTAGQRVQRLIAGGPLNAPWGVALAPAGFGDYASDLLVGNFGDGTINVFNPTDGTYIATLQDPTGKNIVIPGLWGLQAGNGASGGDANAVYFTAGIGGPDGALQSHGLFGSLQAAPELSASDVTNAASFQPAIAPNTFIAVRGSNLSSTTRTWRESDFVNGALPTQLDGVSVTVGGKPAYIYYISPTQLNILTPVDSTPGPVQVQTTNSGLASGSASVSLQAAAPAFFLFANKYVAATHADYSLVGATTLFPNASTPAKPGETIVMYGNGFGPTTPPAPEGQLVTSSLPLATVPTILIGNTPAEVTFAGLVGAGLYQINVVIPPSTPDGDATVVAQANGQSSPSGVFVTVQH
jgi:uncharacterized protein (TIGR03118 family)